ncbi:MAG TPA: hypothetical protein ENG22_00500 [Candidatus Bathyarchaeota archaeon]|nr:hypothetical protein [Candidatus Bathyarchaeota archaeon]
MSRILKKLSKIFSRGTAKTIRVCPRCHSPDIALSTKFDGWLTPEIYVCKRCGYRGPIYLEISVEEETNADESTS